ncbi:MAG: hypothetical protein J4473_05395 [Candidatus Aenigmarchaeota archaeon]|nr:hypothetical protein [Candidatus Aenigmarchaeota archaeon]
MSKYAHYWGTNMHSLRVAEKAEMEEKKILSEINTAAEYADRGTISLFSLRLPRRFLRELRNITGKEFYTVTDIATAACELHMHVNRGYKKKIRDSMGIKSTLGERLDDAGIDTIKFEDMECPYRLPNGDRRLVICEMPEAVKVLQKLGYEEDEEKVAYTLRRLVGYSVE